MNSRKKTIIFVIILGAATLGLICFVIYFLLVGIKKDSKAFISQKKELTLLRVKVEDLRKFEKTFQTNQQNLEKIDTLFYKEVPADIKKFADFLRKTVRDSQISIGEEIPSPGTKKEIAGDPWPSTTFQFSCLGSFSNFAKFLEKLEAAPYLIEISDLSIRRLTEKEVEAISRRVMMEGESRVPSLSDISANLSIKVFTK